VFITPAVLRVQLQLDEHERSGVKDRLAAAHLEPIDMAEVDGLEEPQERLPGTGKIPEPRELGAPPAAGRCGCW